MAQPADDSKLVDSEVFRSKYRKIKLVGKGSFGEAVLVRSKADGKRYIAKAIESAAMSAKEKRDVQNEIKILSAVNHPNIVRYHEHFEDGTLIFIVMEYADGGDLSARIKEQKKTEPIQPLDMQLVMSWFLQITMAMKYLHDKHILHRDLKTANVFLTSKNVVKLGDFGISTVLQNTMACAKTVCGTPYYFSPELCQSKPYNNKSDVWALGVIFYEMLTLNRPFNAKSLKELMKKILVGQYDPLPANIPADMQKLCASLLNINPVQRPSVNRILESAFVQEALRGFSRDLQEQTDRDKMELDEKMRTAPPKIPAIPTSVPTPPSAPAAQKAPSAQDQMAMLRGMGREGMLAALRKGPSADIQAEMHAQAQGNYRAPPTGPQEEFGAADDDAEWDMVNAKQVMLRNANDYYGKAQLGGHPDEFGDAPAGVANEVIVMANGQAVPAPEVRRLLEGEIGSGLLNKAVEFVGDLLSSPHAPSNAEIQRELSALVGVRYAHHSPAIAKLAMFESKVL